MLSVGNGVADNVLQEDLEDTTGLLVDQTRDTLDTTTASQTADGGLGDTLDVITKNLWGRKRGRGWRLVQGVQAGGRQRGEIQTRDSVSATRMALL